MLKASALREKAEKAARLAREVINPPTTSRLTTLAAEYIARAEEQERTKSDGI